MAKGATHHRARIVVEFLVPDPWSIRRCRPSDSRRRMGPMGSLGTRDPGFAFRTCSVPTPQLSGPREKPEAHQNPPLCPSPSWNEATSFPGSTKPPRGFLSMHPKYSTHVASVPCLCGKPCSFRCYGYTSIEGTKKERAWVRLLEPIPRGGVIDRKPIHIAGFEFPNAA